MTQRVVFLDRASLKANVRKPACARRIRRVRQDLAEEIVPRLAGADVAIVNKVPMRARTLEQLPQSQDDRRGGDRLRRGRRRLLQGARHRGRQYPQLRRAHRAGTCVHADPGVAAQPPRLPRGRRRTGVWNKSDQFCFFTHRSATCTARRSASSARARSVRARRPSGAHSACVCCSPIIRRRRWKASRSRRTMKCSRNPT